MNAINKIVLNFKQKLIAICKWIFILFTCWQFSSSKGADAAAESGNRIFHRYYMMVRGQNEYNNNNIDIVRAIIILEYLYSMA